jgi:transposase
MSQRRKYTKEFKLEAVRMTNVPGTTVKQVAEDLGVNSHMLGKWRSQLREEGEIGAFPGQGTPRDDEMAALKRENARLRKERDFLKEAAAFFAKESK